VVDARFGAAVVVILPELLARLSDPAIALFSLDTLVHAIESLVSRRANPVSRALAMTAIELIVEENRSRTRVNRVIAACLAAEAFSSTGLGIAHAVASPLGTKAGVTHDGINGVLGRSVVNFWGISSGFADVCRAFGVGETVEEMTKILDRFRQTAGLPVSLEELGITWGSVAEILPRAAQSSGIPWLPRPLQEGELERFAYQAWSGKGGKA
jgi:alcohol dehydrogenase class IV